MLDLSWFPSKEDPDVWMLDVEKMMNIVWSGLMTFCMLEKVEKNCLSNSRNFAISWKVLVSPSSILVIITSVWRNQRKFSWGLRLVSIKFYFSMKSCSLNWDQSEEYMQNWRSRVGYKSFVESAIDSFVHVNGWCYAVLRCSWKNGYLCSHNVHVQIQSCTVQETFSKIKES